MDGPIQRKIKTIWFPLNEKSKKQKEQTIQKQTQKYRGQFGVRQKGGSPEGWKNEVKG